MMENQQTLTKEDTRQHGLSIHYIDQEIGRVFKWVDSAASKDRARPQLNAIQVKAPIIQSTDGFVVHRATFDLAEKLTGIVQDGCYEVRAIHPTFMVLQSTDCDHFPDMQKVWKRPEDIKSPVNAVSVDGLKKLELQGRYGFNPKLLMRALNIKNDSSAAVITLADGTAPYHLYVGYISAVCGEIRLEAMIMPMHVEGSGIRLPCSYNPD